MKFIRNLIIQKIEHENKNIEAYNATSLFTPNNKSTSEEIVNILNPLSY